MRPRVLIVTILAAGAVAWALVSILRPRSVPSEEPTAPSSASPEPARSHAFSVLTGTLVLRVRSSDGKALPEGAVAGYRSGRDARLRPLSAEGTVRFKDVPLLETGVTRLEAVAEAPGYFPAVQEVLLQRDVPNEALLTLTAAP